MEVYVDASFDPKSDLAICGWMDGKNQIMQTFAVPNTTNTEAEILGVLEVMRLYENVDHLTIYTDCQTIVELVTKRRYNKEIYSRFFELFDKFKGTCVLIKVAGHKNKRLRTKVESNFSKLDIHVRYTLRSFLMQINKPTETL